MYEQLPGFSLKDIYFAGRMMRVNPFRLDIQQDNLMQYELHEEMDD